MYQHPGMIYVSRNDAYQLDRFTFAARNRTFSKLSVVAFPSNPPLACSPPYAEDGNHRSTFPNPQQNPPKNAAPVPGHDVESIDLHAVPPHWSLRSS